ncbi:MAG TPA: alpha/beta hydrolase family protein [Sphingobacteriaceae bacterium]
MKAFRLLVFILLCFQISSALAAKTDTVETWSAVMNKKIKAVVFTPEQYAKGKDFPVVYLLHGYSGNYSDWSEMAGEAIGRMADQHGYLVVCPDGGFSSWYVDSPVDPAIKYETYIAKELVSWVDKNYKTGRSPAGRAITGLSMGGHGALYLAFRHQDIFGAAGSMSGGVDIRPFPKNWDLAARFGSFALSPENWEKNAVINMLHLVTPGSLSLIIDCGTSDFFYTVNRNLHEKMLERNIAHDFISRPGGHSWEYWNNALDYQLLFFKKYFSAHATKVR